MLDVRFSTPSTFSEVSLLIPEIFNWKTLCDRLDRSFMAVAAVDRLAEARSSSS
eukprot:COSAG02_NODE_2749_length_8102_cov_2.238411_7_plen_54_part_00